jgi:hypothetical protein
LYYFNKKNETAFSRTNTEKIVELSLFSLPDGERKREKAGRQAMKQ